MGSSGNILQTLYVRAKIALTFIFLIPILPIEKTALAIAEEIFVVSIQDVISKSEAGKALRKKMESEALERRSELERISEEIRADEEKLQKQSSLLSPDALQEKKDGIVLRQKELARKVQDEKELLGRKSNQQIAKLVEKIREIIPQCVEGNATAIVIEKDPQVVVYAAPNRDITDKLIKLLNEQVMSL